MLVPADGVEGVKNAVLEIVKHAGPNPCPPIVLGIGIGGTMDQAAVMSKKRCFVTLAYLIKMQTMQN